LRSKEQDSAHQSTSDSQPQATVSDWLSKLDDRGDKSSCPLNTDPFLDLASYLRALPTLPLSGNWADSVKSLPPDDPVRVFISQRETAEKLIAAQDVIHQMLRRAKL
jgi:hypothetical protein